MKISEHKLKNGAKIIAINMPNANSVVVNFGFRVGSRDESPKQSGISHFLEHMMFKGSKKRPNAATIAREADRIGASYNAFTGKEYTCYYIKTSTQYFKVGLDIIGDMVTSPLIKQAELDKESGTIIEEIKMYNDNPMINIFGKVEETLYGQKTSMGREIAGSQNTVKSITAASMRKYFKKFYVGDNTVLVLAGNLPNNYLALARGYLSRLPKGKKNIRDDSYTYHDSLRILEKQTEQAHFGIGIPGYSITDSDKYSAEIIATALGGYMSARLFTEIREKRGWAYRIFAFSDNNSDNGYLGIMGGIKKDKILEAIKVTKEEIEKFREHFNNEEISRAKSHLLGAYTLKYEDPEERAKFTVLQELLSTNPETPEQLIKRLQKVTNKEIRTTSQRLLCADNLSLTVIGPYKNKEKFAKILAQK